MKRCKSVGPSRLGAIWMWAVLVALSLGAGGAWAQTLTIGAATHSSGNVVDGGIITVSGFGGASFTGDATVALSIDVFTADYDKYSIGSGGTITVTADAFSGQTFTITYNGGNVLTAGTQTIIVSAIGDVSATAVAASYPVTLPSKAVATQALTGLTVPATGGMPELPGALSGTGFTATDISWLPAVFGTFAASTDYTATVTLAVAPGYAFPATGAVTPTTFITVSGATTNTYASSAAADATLEVVFPQTGAGGGGVPPTGLPNLTTASACMLILLALSLGLWGYVGRSYVVSRRKS